MKHTVHDDLKIVCSISFALLVISFVTGIRFFVFIAAMLLFIGASLPGIAARIVKVWLRVGENVGAVATRTLLTVIYYLFLTPIAIMYRSRHNDPLLLKKDSSRQSWWSDSTVKFDKGYFEKMW